MLKHGLIEEVDAKLGVTAWRKTGEGHGVTLVATDAALAALGRCEAGQREPRYREEAGQETRSAEDTEGRGAIKAPTRRQQAGAADCMLKRAKGANIDEILEAFDREHAVRGAIAGALKKKLGPNGISEKTEAWGRIYRIEA
jgi:hypothetical protein